MTVLIIIEVIVAILLIILVLLQHSDNEGLGFGGSNLGGLMTARGSANLLSRATALVATIFMIMSIILTVVAASKNEKKILESLNVLEKDNSETNIIEEPSIPDWN